MSKQILGTKLDCTTQRHVLAAFVHRLTTENGYPEKNPCKARVPAISDNEWLATHYFFVKSDGSLDARYQGCSTFLFN